MVLIPKGKYNGQKLINAVATKVKANTPSTMAKVPEMKLVKYKIATVIAKSNLTALSVVPIFFFIYN